MMHMQRAVLCMHAFPIVRESHLFKLQSADSDRWDFTIEMTSASIRLRAVDTGCNWTDIVKVKETEKEVSFNMNGPNTAAVWSAVSSD
ncbi:hypothetical protein CEXT_768321 [Caerostris extrusa]|uniref:Uncharacterized protein n=1 Tax=Caerostris extrusa TaxID=172846 RepID=A0AAV4NQ63_CAEEX|nr:hypothetical protein CEXT_768321 [Caerostris extrusa]